MSYHNRNRLKVRLPIFLTAVLAGLLLSLLLAAFSASWGTAYGSTIPVPPSETPTITATTSPTSSPTSSVPSTPPTVSVTPVPTSPSTTTTPTPTATPPGGNPGCPASTAVNPPTGSGGFADPAFRQVWERSDALVAGGVTARTWLWGPGPGLALKEAYGANCQQRLVQYFDKSRMEINNPNGDRNSPWFVTNGLLARELVSGLMQTGDNTFFQRTPAQIPVAGDQNDPNSPTYADLTGICTLAPGQNIAPAATGTIVNANLRRGQGAGTGNLGEVYGVRYTNFDVQSGHNIAGPFWDFLNSSGPIMSGSGTTITGKLFDPTFFATGLPLSEAYWVRAKVGGVEKDVLVQVFERRVLTYTPSNEPQWRVEMGNIGQHYYLWRYGNQGVLPTSTSTSTPSH